MFRTECCLYSSALLYFYYFIMSRRFFFLFFWMHVIRILRVEEMEVGMKKRSHHCRTASAFMVHAQDTLTLTFVFIWENKKKILIRFFFLLHSACSIGDGWSSFILHQFLCDTLPLCECHLRCLMCHFLRSKKFLNTFKKLNKVLKNHKKRCKIGIPPRANLLPGT